MMNVNNLSFYEKKSAQNLNISFSTDRENESAKFLEAANEKSAKITNFVLRFIVVGFLVSLVMMILCKLLYNYNLDGFVEADHLFIPFPMRYTYI